jgi:hypothetical protein
MSSPLLEEEGSDIDSLDPALLLDIWSPPIMTGWTRGSLSLYMCFVEHCCLQLLGAPGRVYAIRQLSKYMAFSQLQGLDFDLIVFPPYRALEGFCTDMEVRQASVKARGLLC